MTTDTTPHSGITRVKKDARYFAASNEPFNDCNLSFGARGIMGYLLSKPDGWEVRNQDLYNKSSAGRGAVDRMLKELKDNGYLRRYKYQDKKGHWHWITEVYELKSLNPDYDSTKRLTFIPPPDQSEKPERTKPDVRETRQPGNPTAGKPSDIVSTELLSTKNNNSNDIFTLYESNIGTISPILVDKLKEAEKLYPAPMIEKAFLQAVKKNARNWSYIIATLEGMAASGYQHPQANGTAKPTPGFFTDLEPETVVAEPVYDDPDIVTLIGSKKEQLPFLDEIKIQLEKGKRVFYARTEMELNALKRCRDLPRYFDQPVELRLSQ